MPFALIAIALGLIIIIGIGSAINASRKLKPELATEAEFTAKHDRSIIGLLGWIFLVGVLLFWAYVI